MAFALSRTSLALRRQAHLGGSLSQDPPEDRRIRLGPRGGKLTTQLACQAVGDAHYALEGDRLLYLEGCDQRFQRLLLVDRATGRRSLVATLPPSLERGAATNVVEAVALAGELAAYTLLERGASPSRRTLFVYDTRAGGVLYRASISPDGSVDGLDLDARGRVVLLSAPLPTSGASRRPCGLVLSWYSPGEPFEHPLAVRVCDRPVRIVGEEIAFLGTSGSPLNRQIRFMSFDGRERVGVDAGRVPIVGYDADERRVAYALRACDGGADLMVNERSGLAFGSRSIRCPVELASRELVVRKGKALVRLWCPRGCTGLMRFRRGGRTISGDPEQFVQTARRGTHRIGVGRRLRRELRRHGRATARLRLVTDDRADRSWTPIEPRVSLRSAR